MPEAIDWLDEIHRLYRLESEATALLRKAVSGARKADKTWQQIAESMGISRQGAAQRFSTKAGV